MSQAWPPPASGTVGGVTPGAGGLLLLAAATLIAAWRLLNAVPTTLTVTAGAVTWVPNTDRRAKFTVVAATTLTVDTTGLAVGDEVDLEVIQDGTGGWELTFPATFILPTGPRQGASSKTEYKFRWDGASFHMLKNFRRRKNVTAAGAYTVVKEDHNTVLVMNNAAAQTPTLPAVATYPDMLVLVRGKGAGAVTVNGDATDIRGGSVPAGTAQASYAVPQDATYEFESDGTNWWLT